VLGTGVGAIVGGMVGILVTVGEGVGTMEGNDVGKNETVGAGLGAKGVEKANDSE
jgi:hypothetical protein